MRSGRQRHLPFNLKLFKIVPPSLLPPSLRSTNIHLILSSLHFVLLLSSSRTMLPPPALHLAPPEGGRLPTIQTQHAGKNLLLSWWCSNTFLPSAEEKLKSRLWKWILNVILLSVIVYCVTLFYHGCAILLSGFTHSQICKKNNFAYLQFCLDQVLQSENPKRFCNQRLNNEAIERFLSNTVPLLCV